MKVYPKNATRKHIDFDIANFSKDLCQYEILVFPSKIKLSDAEIVKVKKFIQSGGSVIALAQKFLNFTENNISQDFGIKYLADSSCDSDYTLIKKNLYPIFVTTPFLNYKAAIKVEPTTEVEVLADIFEPYFNRTLRNIIVPIRKRHLRRLKQVILRLFRAKIIFLSLMN